MYNREETFEYCKRVSQELEQYIDGDILNDDGEQASIYDYMNDILDYEITIDSSMNYKSCKVYVTLGGPTCWIDTADYMVKLRWGTDEAGYFLNPAIVEEIDSYFEELYLCR